MEELYGLCCYQIVEAATWGHELMFSELLLLLEVPNVGPGKFFRLTVVTVDLRLRFSLERIWIETPPCHGFLILNAALSTEHDSSQLFAFLKTPRTILC